MKEPGSCNYPWVPFVLQVLYEHGESRFLTQEALYISQNKMIRVQELVWEAKIPQGSSFHMKLRVFIRTLPWKSLSFFL